MTTKTIPTVDSKQLAPVKARITKAEAYANDLVIKTDGDEKAATIALSELNKIGDEVKDRKETITKPLNAALRSVRELFKPMEGAHEEAVRTIKGKLVAYYNEKKAKEAVEEEKLIKRVEKGTMRADTAAKKMEDIKPVEKNVKTDVGALQYKKVQVATITKKVEELTDKEIVAHAKAGYLQWNETVAKKAALAIGKEGEVIAGVTVTTETRAANIR